MNSIFNSIYSFFAWGTPVEPVKATLTLLPILGILLKLLICPSFIVSSLKDRLDGCNDSAERRDISLQIGMLKNARTVVNILFFVCPLVLLLFYYIAFS